VSHIKGTEINKHPLVHWETIHDTGSLLHILKTDLLVLHSCSVRAEMSEVIFVMSLPRQDRPVRPTQLPIQRAPEALSLQLKWPGREADHSHPSNAEIKSEWSYASTPPIHLQGMVPN
jgi:hypothetical protein